jgi:hypothetical protein
MPKFKNYKKQLYKSIEKLKKKAPDSTEYI